ncbi:hypothetical protein [Methanobacterium oryzae]|uniref:hypothetical protein n=1 Tax=Methanobacterium oryzae TaxID=69540 RepID=UPI003D233EB0
MFCPNCCLEIRENTEYCSKCGVKLENRVKTLNQEKDEQCPYCGYHTTRSKCKNCGQRINRQNHSTITSGIIGFVHAVPGEIKSYKWDNTFVMNNLVIIVAIIGIMTILVLFMNN